MSQRTLSSVGRNESEAPAISFGLNIHHLSQKRSEITERIVDNKRVDANGYPEHLNSEYLRWKVVQHNARQLVRYVSAADIHPKNTDPAYLGFIGSAFEADSILHEFIRGDETQDWSRFQSQAEAVLAKEARERQIYNQEREAIEMYGNAFRTYEREEGLLSSINRQFRRYKSGISSARQAAAQHRADTDAINDVLYGRDNTLGEHFVVDDNHPSTIDLAHGGGRGRGRGGGRGRGRGLSFPVRATPPARNSRTVFQREVPSDAALERLRSQTLDKRAFSPDMRPLQTRVEVLNVLQQKKSTPQSLPSQENPSPETHVGASSSNPIPEPAPQQSIALQERLGFSMSPKGTTSSKPVLPETESTPTAVPPIPRVASSPVVSDSRVVKQEIPAAEEIKKEEQAVRTRKLDSNV